MGNVSSRQEEGATLYLRDQQRFSITALNINNARGRTLLRISPNAFPASRYTVGRDMGDDSPVEFIQDPESTLAGGPPSFLLRLSNDEELSFNFICSIKQYSAIQSPEGQQGPSASPPATDTSINGLTFISASSAKEIEQLMTREFHADPNIHKNPNVHLVGDYATSGAPSTQFSYSWKWKPPKLGEDMGGGWRTTCSFVEYDQRAHKLSTLATFSLWVHNTMRRQYSPQQRSPRLETISPPRLRVPSAQSIESRMSNISDSDGDQPSNVAAPQSPSIEPIPEYGLGLIPSTVTTNSVQTNEKLDIGSIGRPVEDITNTEDGPLFRATMKSLESKTGTLRTRMKRVLRTAEAAEAAQKEYNDTISHFMDALREASTSNANAVRPALEHYFEKIAKEILAYERRNAQDMRKLVIEPINKLYNYDIKQADSKRRDFEEESKDYYAYVGKYLGQRTDSLKERKRVESDSKYINKRRTFELKRFDYSSFMHDLHGGRKDQEILSQLTKYASAQANGFLKTAKKIEEMVPTLEALCQEVGQADIEFQMQRTEREEKRRALEKNSRASVADPDTAVQISAALASGGISRMDSSHGSSPPPGGLQQSNSMSGLLSQTPPDLTALPSRSTSNKFKGIRDLEDKDASEQSATAVAQIRKEGLLWSLSRPGAHIDPKGLKTAGWHKFWIVLDQGKLSEYVNWKDKLDLHMEPIDLRVASVREARNSDRRFCFEVITPQFTRVYQAPSEEDMRSWIAAINNALQSAFEAKNPASTTLSSGSSASSGRKDIAAVLTGKSSSVGHRTHALPHSHSHSSRTPHRHATTGDKPMFLRGDGDNLSSEVLERVRAADEGNKVCADCGSDSKVDWVSINLGIVLCIECSGIHRSLGTHISKIRSLTLDTSVFTPDIIDLLLLIGNRVSNMIWEAKMDRSIKPSHNSTREQRLHFITAKYADRAYVMPDPSHPADETLLTGIKRNEIQKVLHALALGANPNATDRLRGVHAVYLALTAADPAAPGSLLQALPANPSFPTGTLSPPTPSPVTTQSSPMTPERPTTRPTSPPARKPFPVAELLLQNGADIPTAASPFPLSPAARQYLEMKSEQRNGRLGPGQITSVGTSPGRNDGLEGVTPSPGPVVPPKDSKTSGLGISGGGNFSGGIRSVSNLAMGRKDDGKDNPTGATLKEKDGEEAKRDRTTGLRRPGGWSNSGFVGGVKALSDVGKRS